MSTSLQVRVEADIPSPLSPTTASSFRPVLLAGSVRFPTTAAAALVETGGAAGGIGTVPPVPPVRSSVHAWLGGEFDSVWAGDPDGDL